MARFISTRSKEKSLKQSLQHLNACYFVFYNETIKNKIPDGAKDEYIKLVLKNYINSDYILETKENNATD